MTKPRAFYDGAWPQAVRECPAQGPVSDEADTAGARHRDVGLTDPPRPRRRRNPAARAARTPGMRLILLALPVILTVLMLVACGGKGGGGY